MKIKVLFISITVLFALTNFFCSSSKNDGGSLSSEKNSIVGKDGKMASIVKGKPRIIIDTTVYNFGEVPEGAETTHFFKVTNVGTDTLKITDVETSCGCTVPEPKKFNLPPKETTKIKVTFNSRGRVGYNEKSVVVFSNDLVEPQKQLLLKGKVLPKSN
jgi:hypothetical protein